MVSLTQGRVIAETDQERLALELRRFDAQVATEVLRLLTDCIVNRRDGWVQVQVRVKGGSVSSHQCAMNFSKDLDAEHPE